MQSQPDNQIAQLQHTQVEVAIIGAGPTGLAAANLLGQAGISTLLIERNSQLSDCPKAITIDDEGLRICQAMGLSETLLPKLLLNVQAHYISRGHFLAKVAPSQQRNGHPFISTFHQPAFEAALLQGIKRFPNVEVCFQHTLERCEQDEHSVHLTIRTLDDTLLHVECAYLLGCDGAKSSIRQSMGIAMYPCTLSDTFAHREASSPQEKSRRRPIDHTQRWLVVDCVNDDEPSDAAIFFCNPARPAVTVPAPHRGRRWEFMLLPGERGEELLNTDTFYALIKEVHASHHDGQRGSGAVGRAGHPQGPTPTTPHPVPLLVPPNTPNMSLPEIRRKAIYTFYATLATQFAKGRIFLLGDAAHLMPPFGGQGMNSGLRDAHNLCWKLQFVLRGLAHPCLLDSYQQERRPHAAQMILFSSLLGKLIMPTARPIALLRDLLFHSLNVLPSFWHMLSEARIKPQPRYTHGSLVPTQSRESKVFTGTLLPQPHVMTPTGQPMLLDDTLGHGFTLVRLYEKPSEAFANLDDDIWTHLGVHFLCIQPANTSNSTPIMATPDQPSVVIDCEQQISAFLHHKHDLYILVRPDRYIIGVFREGEADRFVAGLQRTYSLKTLRDKMMG